VEVFGEHLIADYFEHGRFRLLVAMANWQCMSLFRQIVCKYPATINDGRYHHDVHRDAPREIFPDYFHDTHHHPAAPGDNRLLLRLPKTEMPV
jgi:ABC-type nickel/cobalt efflux system permease component RcnA